MVRGVILKFEAQGSRLRKKEFNNQDSGFRVQGSELERLVQVLGFRVRN